MPIYRYKCSDCGEEFDFLHKSPGASEEVVCPKCGSKKAEKLLSSFSVSGGDSSSSGPSCSTGSCPTGTCPFA